MSDQSKKATKDSLELLHAAVAEDLIAKIQSGEASAPELAVAVKFLKDNQISAPLGSSAISRLQKSLSLVKTPLPNLEDLDREIA